MTKDRWGFGFKPQKAWMPDEATPEEVDFTQRKFKEEKYHGT